MTNAFINLSANQEMVACPVCKVNTRPTELDNHFLKVHLHGHAELLPDFRKALTMNTNLGLVICCHCKQSIKLWKLPGHFFRAHGALYPNVKPPLGTLKPKAAARSAHRLSSVLDIQTGLANVTLANFKALLQKSRLEATTVERCECRKVVVFVEVARNKLKAFDVDSRRRLTGPHSCDGPKSESIHALLGGAVDSNRRKH